MKTRLIGRICKVKNENYLQTGTIEAVYVDSSLRCLVAFKDGTMKTYPASEVKITPYSGKIEEYEKMEEA